eukprot:NODE_2189_length_1178_cov_17.618246_g1814_i0.p1 GENE.NODE_2189_length_1178_cov_17.618246_g1814_i0~~NODE_2189_length_1178_cov_17.618246_g1814_i0.p1  ORF type:complete len:314 (+),score=79.36 NODE_2189_length_1178_cov_17.618246_g1814_i0:58-999(+)
MFATCGIICVQQSNIGIVETCGKFNSVKEPGCHCIAPFCISNVAGELSLRVQQLDVQVETRTRDSVFIHITVSVQYKVIPECCYNAFYRLSNPTDQLQKLVYNHIRAQIPNYILDDVFTAKDEIAKSLKEDLDRDMADYGYQIQQTLIIDIEPNKLVKESMNEINANQRKRVAAVDKAEAEKIAVVKAAEAEAESKRLSGVGLAEQRKAVIAGLRDSIKDFTDTNSQVSDMQVMELLLMNQYFDTLKDLANGSRSSTVFVPHSPGVVGSMGDQVRDAFIGASSAVSADMQALGGVQSAQPISRRSGIRPGPEY